MKRLDLADGARRDLPLDRAKPFVAWVDEVEDWKTHQFDIGFEQRDGQWLVVQQRSERPAEHGMCLENGISMWIFMQWPEARHAELERAVQQGAAVGPWADWLTEQGDPFGRELQGPTSTRRWWLEGLDVTGNDFSLDGPLVKHARLELGGRLAAVSVVGLSHLRAALALETLELVAPPFTSPQTLAWWSRLARLAWPPTLRELKVPSLSVEQHAALETAWCTARPGLSVVR